MLHRMNNVIANLTVYPENMMRNLGVTGGLVFSQRVLLELPLQGVSREDAYRIVQRNAMKVWEEIQHGKPTVNEKGESLYLNHLLADEELRSKLSEEQIRECFNYDYYIKMLTIYSKEFSNSKELVSFFKCKNSLFIRFLFPSIYHSILFNIICNRSSLFLYFSPKIISKFKSFLDKIKSY